jgi:hypothetical protein
VIPEYKSPLQKFDPMKTGTYLPAIGDLINTKIVKPATDFIETEVGGLKRSGDELAKATKTGDYTGNMVYDNIKEIADPIVIPVRNAIEGTQAGKDISAAAKATGVPQTLAKAGNEISKLNPFKKKKKKSEPAAPVVEETKPSVFPSAYDATPEPVVIPDKKTLDEYFQNLENQFGNYGSGYGGYYGDFGNYNY